MLSGNSGEHSPLDEVDEALEPDLGFKTAWWQDYRNQSALLDSFWAHVKEDLSLVFFYAKQIPLVDDLPGRRFLVGVGRVRSVGPLTEYLYDGAPQGKLRSILWERMMGHSIRPGFEDGFILPYHEALEKSHDGEAFDPADGGCSSTAGSVHRILLRNRACERRCRDRSAAVNAERPIKSAELFDADIRKQEAWIDNELGRLCKNVERSPAWALSLRVRCPVG